MFGIPPVPQGQVPLVQPSAPRHQSLDAPEAQLGYERGQGAPLIG